MDETRRLYKTLKFQETHHQHFPQFVNHFNKDDMKVVILETAVNVTLIWSIPSEGLLVATFTVIKSFSDTVMFAIEIQQHQ